MHQQNRAARLPRAGLLGRCALALALLGSTACQLQPAVTERDLEFLQERLQAQAAEREAEQEAAIAEAQQALQDAQRAAAEQQAEALAAAAEAQQGAVQATLDEHSARQEQTFTTWVASLTETLADKAGAAADDVRAELDRQVEMERERRSEQLERLSLELQGRVKDDQRATEKAIEQATRDLEEAQRARLDQLRRDVELDPAELQRQMGEAIRPLEEQVAAQSDLMTGLQTHARKWIPDPWGEILAAAVATAAAGGMAVQAKKKAVAQTHHERDRARMLRKEQVTLPGQEGAAA